MEGSVLMVYIPDMLPMVLKESGKAGFKVTMSWTTAVEGDISVTLDFMGLNADFSFLVGVLGLLAFRDGRDSLVLDRKGLLHAVPLMTLLMGSLNQTVFMVFLKPLWREVPQRGEVQCDRSRSIRGSWKVTYLAVLLKPLWLGEVGMVRASMRDCAARLGTLNSMIPSHSDGA